MSKLPIIIELCGIPYSGKTTTIDKMERFLKRDKVSFETINEFRGDDNFYLNAKCNPDLNLRRAIKSLDTIILQKYSRDCRVVLIDSGIFDSYCWFKWFEEKEKLEYPLIDVINSLLHSIKNYSKRHYIVWVDADPLESARKHDKQGTIVNYETMTQLREHYSTAFQQLSSEFNITRVESFSDCSKNIALRLIRQFVK